MLFGFCRFSTLVKSIGHHLILPFEHVESGRGTSEKRHTVLGLAVGIGLCLSVQCELAFIYGVNGKNWRKKNNGSNGTINWHFLNSLCDSSHLMVLHWNNFSVIYTFMLHNMFLCYINKCLLPFFSVMRVTMMVFCICMYVPMSLSILVFIPACRKATCATSGFLVFWHA